MPNNFDAIIIGGGFYGCSLALYLSTFSKKVALLEEKDVFLSRASAVNQARVHCGYHYPRSFVTALRSFHNYDRFKGDFEEAIVDDFTMAYAISKKHSKVNAQRFYSMFQHMGTEIKAASPNIKDLFANDMVEAVFECEEVAFDYLKLKKILEERLAKTDVEIFKGTTCQSFAQSNDLVRLETSQLTFESPLVFNVTYANINSVLKNSGLAPIGLKHEWTEIALIEPPAKMNGIAVTVMDGPFFSSMPFPAEDLYSLSHVRYTPHLGWVDTENAENNYDVHGQLQRNSNWKHMVYDSKRFMPCLAESLYKKSLFEIKTVPLYNENNDGRPILFHKHEEINGLFSVLGSKIDNIYDLFIAVSKIDANLGSTSMEWL